VVAVVLVPFMEMVEMVEHVLLLVQHLAVADLVADLVVLPPLQTLVVAVLELEIREEHLTLLLVVVVVELHHQERLINLLP
jgi:hypothetical protein